MPAVRSQVLEIVRDAYPETFEGLGPSKPLGESIFAGRNPHPNEVLNLFVQRCSHRRYQWHTTWPLEEAQIR